MRRRPWPAFRNPVKPAPVRQSSERLLNLATGMIQQDPSGGPKARGKFIKQHLDGSWADKRDTLQDLATLATRGGDPAIAKKLNGWADFCDAYVKRGLD